MKAFLNKKTCIVCVKHQRTKCDNLNSDYNVKICKNLKNNENSEKFVIPRLLGAHVPTKISNIFDIKVVPKNDLSDIKSDYNDNNNKNNSHKNKRTVKIKVVKHHDRRRCSHRSLKYVEKEVEYRSSETRKQKSLCDIILALLLVAMDIERNPGPHTNESTDKNVINVYDKNNFTICSYNVQGLKSFKKLKRVLNLINKQSIKNNCVINLQETHLDNVSTLPYHWKHGLIQSPAKGASSGVAILYSKSYFDEILDNQHDNEGRFCSFTSKKDGETFTFINLYAPNDHYDAFIFFTMVKNKITNILDQFPDTNISISGDFNVVFNEELDSIGRNQTKQEKKVVHLINEIMILFNLVDSYRENNKYGGYTWGKNNPTFLRSRLDYILVSKSWANQILNSCNSPFNNESDHSLVFTEFLSSCFEYGPGVVRVNASILEDPEIKERVRISLLNSLESTPIDWNPHQVLDFFKYNLRKIMLAEGKVKAKVSKSNLEMTNFELNLLKNSLNNILLEIDTISKNNGDTITLEQKANSIKKAIEIAEIPLKELKEQESKKLIFRARAKWVEQGEKSNKYFLNLLKDRQSKMVIRKLISNGKTYYKQDEISQAINEYYEDLYKKQPNLKKDYESNELLKDLPHLDDHERKTLAENLTVDELRDTIKTCDESAPGPDGITYNAYKHLWDISGNLILNAWNHSTNIGKTSTSQREAVITLLEKKGKDKSNVNNLRPISLSNCDIKICTKALAIRTNKILHKLIDSTQTGYIPDRQVTNNNRLIEEIDELAYKTNDTYFLVTLDAQKAFDSVDHDYLLSILKAYNFPDVYISWVKTIYSDLNASVLVNGFTTKKFKIEQSVKQGDALSCALFVLAIEPLLKRININPDIIPVTLKVNKNGVVEEINVKTISYADDITCIVKNWESIQHIIDEYSKFSMISGIKLNVQKTEIMTLGKKQNEELQRFSITYNGSQITIIEQTTVCICGITFSRTPSIAYNKNITEKITKLERQLNIWRQRNLSLEGKILIVKTFGISQLIYSIQSTRIRMEDLALIESIIFRFIWNIKKDNKIGAGKIARSVLKGPKDLGGLNAPDIKVIANSIKMKSLLQSYSNKHPIHAIYQHKLTTMGFILNSYIKQVSVNDYISEGAAELIKINDSIDKDVTLLCSSEDGVHKNYYAFIQNQRLSKLKCFNIHQQGMIHRMLVNNIVTVSDLLKEKSNNNFMNLFLDTHQLTNTIPKSWITVLRGSRRDHCPITDEVCIGLNKWKNISQVSLKDLHISQRYVNNINVNELVQKKFPEIELNDLTGNPFTNLHKQTKDVKLKNIQFKILHNIYPTMKHLHKWKLSQTDKCSYCNQTETVSHAIFHCPIAKDAITKLENLLNRQYSFNPPLSITFNNMLLGISSTSINTFITHAPKYAIDCVLVLLKQKLILQRDNKIFLSVRDIDTLFYNRLNIEKYNCRQKNLRGLEKRWNI